jgi:hypothetical protein
MPPSPIHGRIRGRIAVMVLAVLSVVGLGTTSLVAAPRSPQTRTSAAASASDSPLRLIFWAGQVWLVDPPNGPGPHGEPVTNSSKAVWVDSRGRLHLRVIKVGGAWETVQIESLSAVSFGTYRFVTDSSIATLAKPLDFAMYVFRSGSKRLTNEIDLENGRTLIGMHHGRTSQFVVQPYYRPHHIYRYGIARGVAKTQQEFTWTPGKVRFLTRLGAGKHARVLTRYAFKGADVPPTRGMHVYIELFLHGSQRSVDKGTRTAILDSYTFKRAG